PYHPYHRGDRHGGRRHHHAGPGPVRHQGRGRAGPSPRPPCLDRRRTPGLLGSRSLLWRGAAAGRRPGSDGEARRRPVVAARQGNGMGSLLIFILLAAVSAGAVAYVFLFERLSEEKKTARRLETVKRAETDR